MFRQHFYKSFQRVCKNEDESRCCVIFENCSLYHRSKKKKLNKDSKTFAPFFLDNNRQISWILFQKLLIIPDFLHKIILEFSVTEKVSEGHSVSNTNENHTGYSKKHQNFNPKAEAFFYKNDLKQISIIFLLQYNFSGKHHLILM